MRLLLLAAVAGVLVSGSIVPPVHAEDTTVIKKDEPTDKKVIIKKQD